MSKREAIDGVWAATLDSAHPGLTLVNLVLGMLPAFAGGWVRARLYRWAGMDVNRSAFIMGNVGVRSGVRGHLGLIHIGQDVSMSTDITLNPDADITIADNVTLGPFVRLYTSTHTLGPGSRRCDSTVVAKPVIIERGCWLAMGVTVLPGVTIGHGSVVAAGAVVSTDIPPNSYVEGVPGAVMRQLPLGDR